MTIYLVITASDDADICAVAYDNETAAFEAACEIASRCNDIVDLDLFRAMADTGYGMMMATDDDTGNMADLYVKKVEINTNFNKSDVNETFGEED